MTKRYKVGTQVRIINPGINGVVKEVSDEPGPLSEYWHTIKTKLGERKEISSNLEEIK